MKRLWLREIWHAETNNLSMALLPLSRLHSQRNYSMGMVVCLMQGVLLRLFACWYCIHLPLLRDAISPLLLIWPFKKPTRHILTARSQAGELLLITFSNLVDRKSTRLNSSHVAIS